MTREGNIVVDGVVASCYASVNHDLVHVGMAPLRWFPETIEIKANRPVPYRNVCKRFAHDQSSWVVTGVKKIQELI